MGGAYNHNGGLPWPGYEPSFSRLKGCLATQELSKQVDADLNCIMSLENDIGKKICNIKLPRLNGQILTVQSKIYETNGIVWVAVYDLLLHEWFVYDSLIRDWWIYDPHSTWLVDLGLTDTWLVGL